MSRSNQHHSFDVSLAVEYGIEEAILIHHFQYWIEFNMRCGKNEYDGRTWTYQTLEEIANHFDYLSKDKVKRTIQSLVDQDVLIKGNYNRTPLDRTLWYAFKNQEMFTKRRNRQIEKAKSENGDGETASSHIYTTHTKTDNKTDTGPPSAGLSCSLSEEEEVRFGRDHQDFTIEIENEHGFKQSITRDKLRASVAAHSHGLSRKLIDQSLAITWTQLKNLDIIPNKLLSYAVAIYKKTVEELTECPKQNSSQKEKHQQHSKKSDSSKKNSSSQENRKSLYEILMETKRSMGLSANGEQTPAESCY